MLGHRQSASDAWHGTGDIHQACQAGADAVEPSAEASTVRPVPYGVCSCSPLGARARAVPPSSRTLVPLRGGGVARWSATDVVTRSAVSVF